MGKVPVLEMRIFYVKAPFARKTIAHRFIGGSRRQAETSPVRDGRKWYSNLLSSLTGLISIWNIVPSVKTPGYGLPAFGLENFKYTPSRELIIT